MFKFLRKLFARADESAHLSATPSPSFVFITDYPDLVESIKADIHTFANRVYYEDMALSKSFAQQLYDTLYIDQVVTIDPGRSLEYTNWIINSKMMLTGQDFTSKVILELAQEALRNSSPEEHYLYDAMRFAMLSRDDIDKVRSRNCGQALSNAFGTLKSNKQVQQFLSTPNKKNSIIYVTYSDMVFEAFSER